MKEKLSCAMDIGEQMLVCGAEVHRVEDSIERMCRAMGADRIDVFIITSSMVATVHAPNGEIHTQTRRINATGTDIERLHLLNDLSRRICAGKISSEHIREELAHILQTPHYPFGIECISYAVIAGAFTLFFGGNFMQAAVSACIGALLKLFTSLCEKKNLNRIFIKFISTFFVTGLALCALVPGLITDIDKVLIGNIMTLIPGIGLTNALRDLFVGDSIAGLLRSIEAMLMALAIAAGYFLCMWIYGGLMI